MKFSSILTYFLLWQLAITVIVGFAPTILPLQETYLGGATQSYLATPLLNFRANFDGIHYLSIAEHGYGYAQQAFFPMYPTLIRSIKLFDPLLTAVLISNICFLLALYVFSKLLRLDYKAPVVKWTIISILIFPVSFFFSAVYTESLFFLLLISSFYMARKQRWLLAGVLGAFAAYTRLAGLFILPALISELIITRNKSVLNWLSVLIIPIGLLIYMYFLNQTTGDPLIFMHVQKLFGQNRSDKIILLYQVYWRYAKMIATVPKMELSFFALILELLTSIIFLVSSIASFFKVRISYALFGILAFALPTLTGTFASLPRYVLVCFPVFVIFGIVLSNSRPLVRTMYIVSSLTLMFIYLSLFSRGFWVS